MNTKPNANKFANFSNYEFATDGTVTKNGKAVKSEDSTRGPKYRLTNNDGDRQFIYAEDIKAAFTNDAPVKTATATLAHSKGFTVDLSVEDEDGVEYEAAPAAAAKPKRKAPAAAAKKPAPAAVTAKPAAAKKPAAAAKKPAAKKPAAGKRTFEVLSVETVAQIKKDLKKGTKAEGGFSMQELATKYGKSTSCIVNIKFGRIHKTVQAAK